jgi:hypothetical protein
VTRARAFIAQHAGGGDGDQRADALAARGHQIVGRLRYRMSGAGHTFFDHGLNSGHVIAGERRQPDHRIDRFCRNICLRESVHPEPLDVLVQRAAQ